MFLPIPRRRHGCQVIASHFEAALAAQVGLHLWAEGSEFNSASPNAQDLARENQIRIADMVIQHQGVCADLVT
jgi:hypothetical protein